MSLKSKIGNVVKTGAALVLGTLWAVQMGWLCVRDKKSKDDA